MDRKKIDVILSAVLITASLIILINDNLVEGGMETELGSMFIPRVIAVCVILLAGTIGIESLLKLRKGDSPDLNERIDTTGFIGVGLYFTIFILYWLAVPYLGFIVSTPPVIISIAYLLGGRKPLPIGITAILTPILIYYGCSQYLRVFLPTWSLS